MKRNEAPAPAGGGADEGQTFESMMSRLQALVAKLEEGNLSLEDSIRSFEEGINLVRRCTTVLNQAEQRIQKLTRDASGKPVAEPLGGDEEEEGRGGDELPF